MGAGIIVTVSVLVATGVAVYQSPQFQQWMTTSRRKIAVALHNLGDEIQPSDSASPIREDISMTEEVGEAAEERRRIARAEIMRRAAFLESRRSGKDSHRPLDSFDTLVDHDGNLRMTKEEHEQIDNNVGISTGVDLHETPLLRRGGKSDEPDGSIMSGERLRIDVHSETTSHHPSESLVQFTPTSERPGEDMLFDPFSDSPVRGQTPVSISASSHTEDNQPVYYAHPRSASNFSQQPELLADLDEFSHGNQFQHEVSSAPSTAGSFSHVNESIDGLSDGTLSDLGGRSVGIATPASWSEVGSVISNDDAGHQQLL
ncbi:uncharacterized protein N7459_007099 [Penicillium hispanicum]|uniref:uncharacterized protein n=1 Tax=Penicillium hispanicum TaxID=1080232 RepID=UPI0025419E62|nr:uncharacterized protein N7459_007099 [Penicillium hispanicum]KAJ5578135.1 hypothetical protein N7459_007099 [Penicillium hispanicum]